MKRLWDDNLNKYVDVPDTFKVVITLDIPDEVIYDRDHITFNNYSTNKGCKEADIRMKKITMKFKSEAEMEDAFNDIFRHTNSPDNSRGMYCGNGVAVMLDHVVMVEKVTE